MHNIESPRSDDDAIEQEIIAKGKTAPRVTPADIEANIASIHYHSPAAAGQQAWTGQESAALDTLTFCVIVLRNGFTVVGKSSCASPENFDADIGRKVAHADAVQQIWPLMGYQLKEQLFQATQPAHHPV